MESIHQIFISYPARDTDIVENFKGRLEEYGVKAWVYSEDKTLSVNVWKEIENKIKSSKVFIYIFSKHSEGAVGQEREFDFISKQIGDRGIKTKIFPMLLGDVQFSELPERIKFINGIYWSQ